MPTSRSADRRLLEDNYKAMVERAKLERSKSADKKTVEALDEYIYSTREI